MKLPIRIEVDGEQIEDVELREMSGADIAEVKKVGANGDIYSVCSVLHQISWRH